MSAACGPGRAGPATVFAVVAVFVLLAGSASAQLTHDDFEDRTWNYSSRYFFEVLSFSSPLRWDALWDEDRTGYRLDLGSVLTDEFWIRQEAQLVQDLDEWLLFRFSFLQAEDYDARTLRHRIEIEGPAWRGIRPAVFTELDPFKEWIDLGIGVSGRWPGVWEGSLSFTLVDAVFNRKAKERSYEKPPLYLEHDSSFWIVPSAVKAGFFVSFDTPMILDDAAEKVEYRFKRLRLGFRADAEPAEAWGIHLEASGEWTYKKRNRDAYTPPDPETRRFRRDAGRLRLEGERTWTRPDGFEEAVGAGFQWIELHEVWRTLHDRVEDRTLFKRDFAVYGRTRILLASPLYMILDLFLGNIRHDNHFHHHPEDDHRRTHRLGAKVGLYLGFWFGPGLEIAAFAHFEPDLLEFGGGGVNATLTF